MVETNSVPFFDIGTSTAIEVKSLLANDIKHAELISVRMAKMYKVETLCQGHNKIVATSLVNGKIKVDTDPKGEHKVICKYTKDILLLTAESLLYQKIEPTKESMLSLFNRLPYSCDFNINDYILSGKKFNKDDTSVEKLKLINDVLVDHISTSLKIEAELFIPEVEELLLEGELV